MVNWRERDRYLQERRTKRQRYKQIGEERKRQKQIGEERKRQKHIGEERRQREKQRHG